MINYPELHSNFDTVYWSIREQIKTAEEDGDNEVVDELESIKRSLTDLHKRVTNLEFRHLKA